MRHRTAVTVVAVCVVVAGCGEPSGTGSLPPEPTEVTPPGASGPRPAPTEPAVTDPPSDPGSPGDAPPPDTVVEAAVLDLAAHLGVPPEEVAVVRVDRVTWRDGSLGCPQPGRAYTQVLTEGLRIELRGGGATFRYHSGGDGAPFRCETPGPPRGVEE